MRILFILLLLYLLSCKNAYAQDAPASVIYIDRLPEDGILLDKGWKFQAGDHPGYAAPGYDDSRWQTINPTLDVHDTLLNIPKSGIVWFRIRLSFSSNLLQNQLAISVEQSGASEMYLNGRLLHRFGRLSNNPDEVNAYNPLRSPFSFPVTKDSQQVLAIRFALQPGISYTRLFENSNHALSIVVNTADQAFDQYRKTNILAEKKQFFQLGVFILLAILYLAFYLFYPAKKVNLYFSLYAFGSGLFIVMAIICQSSGNVAWQYPFRNFMNVETCVGNILLLTAVFDLFGLKKGWLYYSILLLFFIVIGSEFFIYDAWQVPLLLFTNLLNFDITRIGFTSIWQNRKGAWIIALGGTSFFLCWIIFSLQATGKLPNYPVDFFTFAVLSIPLAVSIYLGYDFALTYRSLEQKLSEVKILSEEKEQILTQQNETLEKQVLQRTSELQQSLEELKATQAQLIQSEKMASLGELTAGIAHEIQNPLNFVNNFSEVNKELIEELQDERSKVKSARDEELQDEILNDVNQNLEKILHHGKRADAIVKGMLQHSRTSTGHKEPTDINKLADEYLRLSYHGLRAKDKEFNAEMKTEFDEKIGNINIIPQDIGRVLLNLFNNAFYATNEKMKQASKDLAGFQNLTGLSDYKPAVIVTTKKTNDKVLISVKDNGNGIPQKIVDKIFQPFFTTKPTGQGTGLGLSLSYDIIKAHDGEIKVQSKEGGGAEFTIELPSKKDI